MEKELISKKRTREIFKQFGNHISEGQIRYLSAGHLDMLEGNRLDTRFSDATTGKTYFDGFSSAGSFNTGRRNSRIVEALCDSLHEYDMGTPLLLSLSKIEFARKLVDLAPGDLNKVLFTGSGADSIEAAIKLARGATSRKEIISMINAYHGHSGFSLSAGGKDYYKELFQPLMPDFRLAPFGDLEAIKQLASPKTAAILIEPIQGEGGINVGTNEYLQGLRTLCDDLGIVLIFDEIQTGFGRTGRTWFSEYSEVVPDVMALAKSIGGGVFPNGAIVYRDTPKLTDFVNDNPFFHTSSGGGSNIGCRISAEVIDELIEKQLSKNTEKMGNRLKNGLSEIMLQYPESIREIRGKGLMIGIEYKHEFMGMIMADSLSKSGVFAAYSGNAPQVMRLMLPLTITEAEVDEFLIRFRKAMKILGYYLVLLLPLTKITIIRKWVNDPNNLIPISSFLRKFGF
ncbi:MAG: putrescine aminotransferase [Candidatus Magnetoglobus multicellularis str. Araruama]|uniref:Taurine--pyruvate aminotransferase n=1 Tax=Candidatus Magnetoglobus multicellularis str. Araruama TaxID=890399 RepID=A0A1V1P8Q5_9BACT|nr:MAG: putrescine aminotransferase [Candidatus Magnetoglobus multicellularis str. Araruama]